MGTYNKDILNVFSGKVGAVVGTSWRGKEIMRSVPKKSNKVATPAQLLQRLKFATVITFLGSMYPILNRYYGTNAGELTRMNKAISYHLKEVAVYNDPDFIIQYNKVQISRGDLLGIQAGAIASTTSNTIDFTWEDNSGQGEALTTDQLVVGVYEPTTKSWIYSLAVGNRSTTAGALLLPTSLSGATVEVWALFASADEKRYATSTYFGNVVVS